MSELTKARDWARAMADGGRPRPKGVGIPCQYPRWLDLTHEDCQAGPGHCRCQCHDADRPEPPTEAERELWRRLADEMDAHLARENEETLL